MIYRVNIGLDPRVMMHTTNVYHLFDLVGDIGGVLEVFMIALWFFLAPISQFSFEMSAMKRLFLAKTLDPTFFV
jgi:hypothetical protein